MRLQLVTDDNGCRCIRFLLRSACCLAAAFVVTTAEAQHAGHKMIMDVEGMVMNWNTDELPRGCSTLAGEAHWTVHVGTRYAEPGMAYGFDRYDWQADPCTKVTVTLVNDDQVRHQWMVHGLPRYLYPQGMFHLEANGGFQRTGTFILPGGDSTLLVHCDVSQHMETGLKAQLRVGKGRGNLSSIPGISGPRYADAYRENPKLTALLAITCGGLAGLMMVFVKRRH